MEEISVATWEEFIEGLEDVRRKRAASTDYVQDSALLYRGQGNSFWKLGATLERKCARMLYKDYYRIISKIKPQIETLVGGTWQIPSNAEVERLVQIFQPFSILFQNDRSVAEDGMLQSSTGGDDANEGV